MTLKTCTAYLSVRTNNRGVRVWALLVRNQPACADSPSLRDVLTVAQQILGRVTLSVWDGDQGEFVSELVADPNY